MNITFIIINLILLRNLLNENIINRHRAYLKQK